LRAFRRLVEATEASAIQFFIVSFSSCRLKTLFLFFFLSFFDFFGLAIEELEKNDEGGTELELD
jgi:hypothetical protein